jgi:hypothetical protein
VPSPFDAPLQPEGGKLNGAGVNALLDIVVDHNVLTFSGVDKIGSSAIEADGGYGVDDLAVDVNHNSITGFNYGLAFYQCTSECSTGVFTAISAVSNDLLDNTVGIS